ncbi:phage major tail tube protein [Geoalkalibacter subterraneus]|uniref:Major tail tube protein n=1 Tax=Geoalkalibacter subterraneus TaxID=483547 RepID=A0A0B5FK32_9BACT|nr:phage major tail tube protein [Geoalkalibacter subterraneus]AJF07763.1 major tail tube protein [Geoalkalibacter subterraneus]
MLSHILRNFSLFVDGRGYAGDVEELTPPKLTMLTEEFRGGGMDAPVDVEMGMEKMECEFTLTKYDREVIKLFGLAPGNTTPLTLRGSAESEDGDNVPVVINLVGKIRELEHGSWKAGEKATLKAVVSLRAYKYTQAGEVLHDIDIMAMRRVIGGVDQMAATRANLGI